MNVGYKKNEHLFFLQLKRDYAHAVSNIFENHSGKTCMFYIKSGIKFKNMNISAFNFNQCWNNTNVHSNTLQSFLFQYFKQFVELNKRLVCTSLYASLCQFNTKHLLSCKTKEKEWHIGNWKCLTIWWFIWNVHRVWTLLIYAISNVKLRKQVLKAFI